MIKEFLELKTLYKTYKFKKDISSSTAVRQVLGFPDEIITCKYLTNSSVSYYFCESVCPVKNCKEKQKISL